MSTPNNRIDRERVQGEYETGLDWYNAQIFDIEGRGWTNTEQPFDRLPLKAKEIVLDPVWALSHHSAGLYLRFITDATEISVRWRLREERLALDFMPASGVSGIDLYARNQNMWRWVGLARPSIHGENTQRILVGIPSEPHEYLLYLPLYNGVDALAIGVNPEATVWKACSRIKGQLAPIVFYGTSITQGASASRPGMTYPAILGRRLDRPVINLGFASNGTMDPELADLMAEIDAAVYIIDCVPNMDEESVADRTVPFVQRLRQRHPETPIVLVEGIEQRNAWLLPNQQKSIEARNARLKTAYKQLRSIGEKNVHYITNHHLLGPSSDSAVDGIHPSDWGFQYYADTLEPVLRRLVKYRVGDMKE